MVSDVAVTYPGSIGAVALYAVSLSVLVAGVALEVSRAASGGTVSARGLLMGGRTSLGIPLFRLVYREGPVSSMTGIVHSED